MTYLVITVAEDDDPFANQRTRVVKHYAVSEVYSSTHLYPTFIS